MGMTHPTKKPVRAGHRAGICSGCYKPIRKNEWVFVAPGRGILFRHTTCKVR